jgi:uncharacterized protein (TIGR02284 family)
MSTATMNLPQKSIDWLQDLIQVNIDSRDGFEDAANELEGKNSALAHLFRNMSVERASQARELQSIVASNSKTPEKSGSISAAAHRAWMDLRSALGGGQYAILSEAERGEDHIKEKYEAALDDLSGCTCTSVLQRQYAAVKASHDAVRDLRDREKNR